MMEDGQEKKDEKVEKNDDQKNNNREEIFSDLFHVFFIDPCEFIINYPWCVLT